MKLAYDPGNGPQFWDQLSRVSGYPAGEYQPIPLMIFASDAIYQTPQVLQQTSGTTPGVVLAVMDETPMQRSGQALKPLLLSILQQAGWQVETAVMKADATGQVHTDMPHIEAVKAYLRPGMAVLSIGSGVVTDITKHACYLYQQEGGEKLPFVVYQTANSVSAYTSNMAPVFVNGVKRTLNSRYPDALICDLETLRDAPAEMTVAGVGDLLAFYVSIPDWYLANQLGMDPSYTLLPQTMFGPMDTLLHEQAENIRTGQFEGVAVLAKLISLGGLAMSLSHATTPFSGYEHVMSHILDLEAEKTGQPLASHGTQVALNTILCTGVYQQFLDSFHPEELNLLRCYPSAAQMREVVELAFAPLDPSGQTAEECWADYQQKLEHWHAHKDLLAALPQNWDILKTRLEQLTCPPERIADILRAVGSPLRYSELQPPIPEQQVHFAFMNAPLMRKRLTIGDLLIYFGWDRESLWQQVWQRGQELAGAA